MEGDFRTGPRDSSVSMWRNHYSSKYNKCLLWITYVAKPRTRDKDDPIGWNVLVDAFERGEFAQSAWGPLAGTACIDDDAEVAGCEAERSLYLCSIGYSHASCAKSAAFISEAMKD